MHELSIEKQETECTPPLVKTVIPSYTFEKISIDTATPNSEASSGNVYIIRFVDWLTN